MSYFRRVGRRVQNHGLEVASITVVVVARVDRAVAGEVLVLAKSIVRCHVVLGRVLVGEIRAAVRDVLRAVHVIVGSGANEHLGVGREGMLRSHQLEQRGLHVHAHRGAEDNVLNVESAMLMC